MNQPKPNPVAVQVGDTMAIDEFPLVVALRTIGVPWADENCRMQNKYTEDFLRKIGKTVEEAMAEGTRGDKQMWMFKATPECQAAIPIFREIWDTKTETVDFPDMDLVTMLRVGILFLKNRGPIAKDFMNHKPSAVIKRGSDGECTILMPSTPKEGREQMGITG